METRSQTPSPQAQGQPYPAGWRAAGAAVRLVRPSVDRTRIQAEPDALSQLELLGDQEQVRVCSLSGTQREGKSTLLNMLFDGGVQAGTGFQAGHAMDPETAGLWIRLRRDPEDEHGWLVMLDTEGLDSPHVPQFYNWCLAALALLVSDCFLYQSRGSIDARSVDRLDVILRVAEQLARHSQQDQDDNEASQPSFMWILRDHHLTMKHEPRREMSEKLSEVAFRSLKRSFGERYDCFPLPSPHARPADIAHLAFEDLEPAFKDAFAHLKRRVRGLLRPGVRRGDRPMTGPLLAGLVRTYCAAVGDRVGALREIEDMPTQAQMLTTLAAERSVRAGLAAYDARMNAAALTMDSLGCHHAVALEAASKAFSAAMLGDANELENRQAALTMQNEIACFESDFCLQDGEIIERRKLASGKLKSLATRLQRRASQMLAEARSAFDETFEGPATFDSPKDVDASWLALCERFPDTDLGRNAQCVAKVSEARIHAQITETLRALQKEQESLQERVRVEMSNSEETALVEFDHLRNQVQSLSTDAQEVSHAQFVALSSIRENMGALSAGLEAARQELETLGASAVSREELESAGSHVQTRLTRVHDRQKQVEEAAQHKARELEAQLEAEVDALRRVLTTKDKELVRLWTAIGDISCNISEIHDHLGS
ncbi:Guanylate-binding protein 1 [Hondaea fermentalgiana]|uniref:Guanylate-binding protein 1 n=1 Tax=Hondaea fermentalgiana TaxID=2315210 RepID=A0A2R5GMS1_9STRA|nr:Guanylate-binding protein 1 [Hondaea fermentalgiana]|eukprot:GBG32190.1 Guanylate-binding protein 1 [Hondaea fermentalgiana]